MNYNMSLPEKRDTKKIVSVATLASSCAPDESSSFEVERSTKNQESPATTAKSLELAPAAEKKKTKSHRKVSLDKDECGEYSSDESSEIDDNPQPGAFGIAGCQMTESQPIEEDQPAVDEANIADGDNTAAQTKLVEADLAPELTSAEEINIQEEEDMILKKKQYQRVLWFSLLFYALAIIGNIVSFVLFFVNPPLAFGRIYHPLWNGLVAAVIFEFIATWVIFIPTRPCCRPSIKLEEYAPDDTQLLRDAQISSVVSFCLFTLVAIPIIVCLPDLQWLGYAFMTCFFAGTVFTFSRVWLLRRSKETRQKKHKVVWFGFACFFLALCGLTIWRCLNPIYPDCYVPCASCMGNGWCNSDAYATEACGYDAGDCVPFLRDYPGCNVSSPSLIGNGFCDAGDYNTKECGYDGGDCIVVNPKYPDCNVPHPYWIGDGKCDGRVYGTVECGYDGGDCLKPGERCQGHRECASEVCNSVTKVCDSAFVSDLYPNCSVGMPNRIGDGECDGGYYASEACGFDGGDCLKLGDPCSKDEECASAFCNAVTKVCYLGVLESYPDCIVEYPKKIGDGECDGGDYAAEECGYDGGDCLNPETLNSSVSPILFLSFRVAAIICFAFFHFIL